MQVNNLGLMATVALGILTFISFIDILVNSCKGTLKTQSYVSINDLLKVIYCYHGFKIMLGDILKIAFLCITIGSASIPISFTITSSPLIVWIGNTIGSLLSAFIVIFIGDRITNKKFMNKLKKRRGGKKIANVFIEGDDNKKVQKAQSLINKHGLKIFALLCPIFPGVLISTSAVYILGLDKKVYKRWMFSGVLIVSGVYVFIYWWTFVKTH